MKTIDAKTQLLAHSKAKIELYSIYLSIYLNIIQRDGFTEKIYLYDLFCGEGEYSDGSRGSPLVALDVIEKMMEAKWKIDEQEGRGFKLDKQGKLFTCKELDDFPNEVKEFIKSTKNCTNKDLYKFGLTHGYLPKHLREILCQFQDEGFLYVSSEDGEKTRKGAFYLGYNNHSPSEKEL